MSEPLEVADDVAESCKPPPNAIRDADHAAEPSKPLPQAIEEADPAAEPSGPLPNAKDFLSMAIQSMLAKLPAHVRKKMVFNLRQIGSFTVGSMCSGSEVQAETGRRVVEQVLGVGRASYATAFSCELDERKALKWIRDVVQQQHGTTDQCIFRDVTQLGNECSYCIAHARLCRIPSTCNLAVGSWSCKDYSKLKSTTSQRGTTSSTLQGILDYLDKQRPLMYVGENLDDIVKADAVQELRQHFAAIGYAVGCGVLQAHHYGAATTRKRGFVIAMECRVSGLALDDAFDMIKAMFELVDSMRIPPMSLTTVMLPDSHAHVQAELDKRTRAGHVSMSDTLWQGQLFTLLQSKGLSWSGIEAPQEQQQSPWFATLAEREQMNLGYYLAMDKATTSVDCYQSPGRCFVGKDNLASTIVPGSKIWSVARRRPITGLECLLIHGFSLDFFDTSILERAGVSDELMKDLAGNSVVGHCYAAVLVGIIAHWPTHAALKPKAESPEHIETDAISMLLGI
jgi:site-specific DNA-cytosine methylase